MELRALALQLLCIADAPAKAEAVREACRGPGLTADPDARLTEPLGLPGRPARPGLVPARQLPQRTVGSPEGRAALLHSIAHIEFNAINLALDAVWRFAGLPEAFYLDWMRVADEEALHFQLVRERLRSLGRDYGDYDAHDGLWEMARRTAGDATARMALVPRTLEARGLDANPAIRARLAAAGDQASAQVLDIILRDEIGHVAIGNHWYRWLCARDGRDPLATYAQLAHQHSAPRLHGPFNLEARRAAGFGQDELNELTAPGRP